MKKNGHEVQNYKTPQKPTFLQNKSLYEIYNNDIWPIVQSPILIAVKLQN